MKRVPSLSASLVTSGSLRPTRKLCVPRASAGGNHDGASLTLLVPAPCGSNRRNRDCSGARRLSLPRRSLHDLQRSARICAPTTIELLLNSPDRTSHQRSLPSRRRAGSASRPSFLPRALRSKHREPSAGISCSMMASVQARLRDRSTTSSSAGSSPPAPNVIERARGSTTGFTDCASDLREISIGEDYPAIGQHARGGMTLPVRRPDFDFGEHWVGRVRIRLRRKIRVEVRGRRRLDHPRWP